MNSDSKGLSSAKGFNLALGRGLGSGESKGDGGKLSSKVDQLRRARSSFEMAERRDFTEGILGVMAVKWISISSFRLQMSFKDLQAMLYPSRNALKKGYYTINAQTSDVICGTERTTQG